MLQTSVQWFEAAVGQLPPFRKKKERSGTNEKECGLPAGAQNRVYTISTLSLLFG